MIWESAIKLRRLAAQNAQRAKYGYIKLGYSCNNNCLFCTASWKKKHGDRQTRTVLDEVERIIRQDQVNKLVYSGGEPTVRNDLFKILSHAKRLGVADQDIQTNGRKLQHEDYIVGLRTAGLTSCFISLHGHDADTHDFLTQTPGSFAETCRGLYNTNRSGITFATNTVVTKQNYHSLESLVRFLGGSFPSISMVKLSYPNLQGGAADNLSGIVAPLWEVAPYIISAIKIGIDIGIRVMTEFMPFCFHGDYYSRADYFNTPRLSLSDVNIVESDWQDPRDAVFYSACSKCDLLNLCCGIHPLHHKTFGEHSCFTAVSLSLPNSTDIFSHF